MASWDDVRRIVAGLPETTEGTSRDHLFWRVKGKGFVWERPLRQTDLTELGDGAPEGPILGVRVESIAAKDALLADPAGVYFTTSHFDGHAIVLVLLDAVADDELRELVIEAWLCRAPPALARAYAHEVLGEDTEAMAYDEALAERVRELVASMTGGDFAEKKMFGGLAFLIGGHMGVTLSRQGGLMLRVDPEQTDAMLSKPHAGPFHMRGRPLDGWVRVEAEGLRTRSQLERWVARGVQYAPTL